MTDNWQGERLETFSKVFDAVNQWPERSEWVCELFGTGPHGIQLRPLKGHEPNWFWRWMQYLCFGNKWRKVKP